MSNARKPATDTLKNELTDRQLDMVGGGTTAAPRDAASGLATGKRQWKPLV